MSKIRLVDAQGSSIPGRLSTKPAQVGYAVCTPFDYRTSGITATPDSILAQTVSEIAEHCATNFLVRTTPTLLVRQILRE